MHQHLFAAIVPLFFFCLSASGIQTVPVSAGKWKVISVNLSDQFEYNPASKANLEQIAAALSGSYLELRKNGRASFNTKVPQLQVADARWTYHMDEGRLSLTESKGGAGVLMEFLVATNDQQTLFYLMESPFVLEMKKE